MAPTLVRVVREGLLLVRWPLLVVPAHHVHVAWVAGVTAETPAAFRPMASGLPCRYGLPSRRRVPAGGSGRWLGCCARALRPCPCRDTRDTRHPPDSGHRPPGGCPAPPGPGRCRNSHDTSRPPDTHDKRAGAGALPRRRRTAHPAGAGGQAHGGGRGAAPRPGPAGGAAASRGRGAGGPCGGVADVGHRRTHRPRPSPRGADPTRRRRQTNRGHGTSGILSGVASAPVLPGAPRRRPAAWRGRTGCLWSTGRPAGPERAA